MKNATKMHPARAITMAGFLSLVVLCVSAFAIWQRSTVGWIVAAAANAACAWIYWSA